MEAKSKIKSYRIGIRVDEDTKEMLEERAKQARRTLSDYCRIELEKK